MSYPVFARTPIDAKEWARTTRTQLNPTTGGLPADRGTEAAAYPVETRLPNGKPALLLDIGSVGNLA
eukprot:10779324-Alexandrium_andersonii.AAC.1